MNKKPTTYLLIGAALTFTELSASASPSTTTPDGLSNKGAAIVARSTPSRLWGGLPSAASDRIERVGTTAKAGAAAAVGAVSSRIFGTKTRDDRGEREAELARAAQEQRELQEQAARREREAEQAARRKREAAARAETTAQERDQSAQNAFQANETHLRQLEAGKENDARETLAKSMFEERSKIIQANPIFKSLKRDIRRLNRLEMEINKILESNMVTNTDRRRRVVAIRDQIAALLDTCDSLAGDVPSLRNVPPSPVNFFEMKREILDIARIVIGEIEETSYGSYHSSYGRTLLERLKVLTNFKDHVALHLGYENIDVAIYTLEALAQDGAFTDRNSLYRGTPLPQVIEGLRNEYSEARARAVDLTRQTNELIEESNGELQAMGLTDANGKTIGRNAANGGVTAEARATVAATNPAQGVASAPNGFSY